MSVLPEYPPTIPIQPDWTPETIAVQAGRPPRVPGAAINPPISLSSTYIHDTDVQYGRDGNVGYGAFETALGTLDGGTTISFSSGLAVATALADLVPTGGTIVLPEVAYFGVRNVFARMEKHGRLTVRPVAPDDTEAVVAACVGADVVWVEAIANPLMAVADVPAIAGAAHDNGAIVIVDATFATPLRQRPLDLGADIVMHSATKLLGGHSDLLLGAATCKDPVHAEFLWTHRHDHGAVPGALEAFLATRGLRTLAVRLDRAEASAGELARRLTAHPHVSRVYYPGLPDDPQHERASRVLSGGYGSMLSFDVDGDAAQTEEVLGRLQLVAHATSLGGVESLIERRARWAGDASIVGASLCRMSVGIENVDNIWADLDQALRATLG